MCGTADARSCRPFHSWLKLDVRNVCYFQHPAAVISTRRMTDYSKMFTFYLHQLMVQPRGYYFWSSVIVCFICVSSAILMLLVHSSVLTLCFTAPDSSTSVSVSVNTYLADSNNYTISWIVRTLCPSIIVDLNQIIDHSLKCCAIIHHDVHI